MDISHIDWLVLGLILSILEMLIPGIFMIWIGIAAFLTSIVAYLGACIYTQIISFVVFSIVSTLLGKKIYDKLDVKNYINQRAKDLVGEEVTLLFDIENGKSRVNLADSQWTVKSDEQLKKGDKAKVVSVSGNILVVKKI
jgi:membrane protein implicated in regulation of membrane protease activity